MMVIDMTDTKRIFQVTTILGTVCLIGLILYFLSQGYFTDSTKLQALLNQTGIFAPLLFILLQIFQVIVPIIPGGASSALGVVAFGPLWGFIYNYVGLVIGSISAFLLVKKYGRSFILKVCDQKTYDKYIGWLNKGKTFDRFFAAAIFFPCAPDDILCMIAGLTSMTLKKFSMIIILGKPAALIAYSYGLSEILKIIDHFI